MPLHRLLGLPGGRGGRLRGLLLFFFLLGFGMGLPSARGQSALPGRPRAAEELRFLRDPSAAVAISADEILEDRERQRVIGRGFADLRYLGKRIQADHIEIHTETRDGLATGNVVIQDRNDRLVGSRVEFNLDTERMVIYDARGFIGAIYYVTGDLIRRLSEDRYEVLGGTFTTCEGDVPDWAFHFKKANFQIEGYAQIATPLITVAGVPAAALPWAIVPVKTKRATGFLMPGIGGSSRNGTQISPSFFWAINDWSDATFGFDYFTKRGIRYKGEYRYRLSENTAGRIRGRTIKDKIEKTTFWDIKSDHRTVFPELDSTFTAFVDEAKRVKVDRSLEPDLIERTRQDTDTRVTFVHTLRDRPGQFQVGLRRREGLNESNGQLFQRAPEVLLNINQERLGTSDFYSNLEASFVNFRRVLDENTVGLRRGHVSPSLSLPLQIVPWLGVTPRVEFAETFWTHQKRDPGVGSNPDSTGQREAFLSREMWGASLGVVGPRLSRVYEGEIGPFRNFKHIISFTTDYGYRPAMDSDDRRLIIPLDGVDSIQDENRLTYGINNRLLTKLVLDEVEQTRQLFSFDVRQSYDIAEARREQDLAARSRRPFSDVALEFAARPLRPIRLLHRTLYNPYEGEIREHSTGIRLDGGRNWYFVFDRTWKRHRNTFPKSTGESFINLAGGLALTPRFFVEYQTRLNKKENATLEQSVILRYRSCCWGVTLTLTDTRDHSEVMLQFSLLGVLEGERVPRFRSRRKVEEKGRFLGGATPATLPFLRETPGSLAP